MAFVKAGHYTPLYREKGVAVNIAVNAFYFDKYQVTNKQFLTFIDKHPKWEKNNVSSFFADQRYLHHLSGSNRETLSDSPVVNVSWYAALAYCKAEGKTLPTVDQWEYTGRASKNQANATKEIEYRQKILEWYSRPASLMPTSVYSSAENYWGIHGMHGVVWEHVKDFNNTLVTGESRGDGTLDNQFFCGSGAAQAVDPSDYAAFMRYAFRSSYQANFTLSSLGFRCAKNASNKIH